ncbi:hypothetical protein [Streptomyces spiramenti]|uniref:hypothetical protein n=1 Tax=Streptomyces spiramenti TaxID=2720606 RepID=UPI001FD8698A|nr:hypothetical protein [Streptomyces spiramenti]
MHQLRSIEGIKAMSEGPAGPQHGDPGETRDNDQQGITAEQWRRANLIRIYHQMQHELRPVNVAIGLGGHDLGMHISTPTRWVNYVRKGWGVYVALRAAPVQQQDRKP